ncbi:MULTISPECIES: type II toxin-antitoxin system prevent-host-death family antitoxin [spotted fever group]|uniref:Antitoxin n=1 Tax=Rickettsia argasii T170-B TaxID=1268837 RepID=A0A0F3RCC2_9RICK|nr:MULTISPECIES: type II toxin-antitoxin system prevent-host-death family antitoxin [spotted fever group]KJV77141.1 prevent-host-death family protein [Rickettsia hoogstraalii str. RCCE3]KJV77496.1 prevent-host-death family protein [Rickettsia hoogstraalii str. RCCE3]KJW03933.1 prevent-host-death family protein [Rickettsia argasii T170-B]
MKKWQLPEAKKNLEKIIDQVLQGRVQAIVKSSGEVVYLIAGEKNNMIAEQAKVGCQAKTDLITSEIYK